MNAEEIQSDSRRLSLFRDLARIVVSARGSEEALPAMVASIRASFSPYDVSVWLVEEKFQELRLAPSPRNPAAKQVLKVGEGVAGQVAASGAPLLMDNAAVDGRFADLMPGVPGDFAASAHSADSTARAASGSIICAPIKGRDRVLGVIQVECRLGSTGERLGKNDLGTIEVLADYLAIALENARLGILDHGTGFYNAGHLDHVLETEISRSQRFRHEFSIVFMDLDHLRAVNDTCGHLVGSKLVGMVGELVRSRLRQSDSAFRYGGDEFVLVLPGATKQNALVMVRRLAEALNATEFDLGEGRRSRMTASYGIASFPSDGSTGQDLLRVADETMSRVKSTTRNGIALAGEELREYPLRDR